MFPIRPRLWRPMKWVYFAYFSREAQPTVIPTTLIPATTSWNLISSQTWRSLASKLCLQAPHSAFRAMSRDPGDRSSSLGWEPNEFFLITDCNRFLSRLKSATSFFSRAFSSRRCRTSFGLARFHAPVLGLPDLADWTFGKTWVRGPTQLCAS
jgi:hypothetical protein